MYSLLDVCTLTCTWMMFFWISVFVPQCSSNLLKHQSENMIQCWPRNFNPCLQTNVRYFWWPTKSRWVGAVQPHGTIPLATSHHCHYKLQLITFFPFNLLLTPLDHEDQRLWLKKVQPVIYDNQFVARAAHWISNTTNFGQHSLVQSNPTFCKCFALHCHIHL